MRFNIRAKVFILALVPPALIAIFLTWFNFQQSNNIGDTAVEQFTEQMQKTCFLVSTFLLNFQKAKNEKKAKKLSVCIDGYIYKHTFLRH